MSFDFQNNYAPVLSQNHIEFGTIGEVMHGVTKESQCSLDPKPMKFLNHETTFAQLLVSEAAATCMANAFASSEVGKVLIDKKTINQMFASSNLGELHFNTTSLNHYLPLFKEKLGKDVPMVLQLSFNNIQVLFGQYASDLIFEYTVGMEFKRDFLPKGTKKPE